MILSALIQVKTSVWTTHSYIYSLMWTKSPDNEKLQTQMASLNKQKCHKDLPCYALIGSNQRQNSQTLSIHFHECSGHSWRVESDRYKPAWSQTLSPFESQLKMFICSKWQKDIFTEVVAFYTIISLYFQLRLQSTSSLFICEHSACKNKWKMKNEKHISPDIWYFPLAVQFSKRLTYLSRFNSATIYNINKSVWLIYMTVILWQYLLLSAWIYDTY